MWIKWLQGIAWAQIKNSDDAEGKWVHCVNYFELRFEIKGEYLVTHMQTLKKYLYFI